MKEQAFDQLPTPELLLDLPAVERNAARMRDHVRALTHTPYRHVEAEVGERVGFVARHRLKSVLGEA